MGYTHYWRRPRTINAIAYANLSRDAYQLALAWEGPIAREYDVPTEAPVFTDRLIQFNGVGDDGHETFSLPRTFKPESWDKPEAGRYFDFCKTARKPYDTLVCAILIAARHHLADAIKISSDGDWDGLTGYEHMGTWVPCDQPEWRNGRTLYARVFPERTIVSPLA